MPGRMHVLKGCYFNGAKLACAKLTQIPKMVLRVPVRLRRKKSAYATIPLAINPFVHASIGWLLLDVHDLGRGRGRRSHRRRDRRGSRKVVPRSTWCQNGLEPKWLRIDIPKLDLLLFLLLLLSSSSPSSSPPTPPCLGGIGGGWGLEGLAPHIFESFPGPPGPPRPPP